MNEKTWLFESPVPSISRTGDSFVCVFFPGFKLFISTLLGNEGRYPTERESRKIIDSKRVLGRDMLVYWSVTELGLLSSLDKTIYSLKLTAKAPENRPKPRPPKGFRITPDAKTGGKAGRLIRKRMECHPGGDCVTGGASSKYIYKSWICKSIWKTKMAIGTSPIFHK